MTDDNMAKLNAGEVTFQVEDQSRDLTAGCWLYLEPETEHSLVALADSYLLVTKIASSIEHS